LAKIREPAARVWKKGSRCASSFFTTRNRHIKPKTSYTNLGTSILRNAIGGVWECPDLFQLPVERASHDDRSVKSEDEDGWKKPAKNKSELVVNVNPGAVAGGSGAQYFLGNFDGKQFTRIRADGVASTRTSSWLPTAPLIHTQPKPQSISS